MAYSKVGRQRGDIIAALDIGAAKVSCLIARQTEGDALGLNAEILGAGHYGLPMTANGLTNAERLETAVRTAVDAAERMAGMRISSVIVGVSGRFLHARRVGVDLDINDGVVAEDDVDDCLCEGAGIAAPPEFTSLHALPIDFKVDGEALFADPVGLFGETLSTTMLGVSARESVLENLSGLLSRCGLSAKGFVAAPFAASEAVLSDDERDLGVVFIDIGAANTGFSIFDRGEMIACGGVNLGGLNITKDIAQIFSTSLAHAERIKTLHGAALLGAGDENRLIEFPQLGDEDVARASRAELCEVIIPRMEEILELVARQSGLGDTHRPVVRRAVIAGGGSLLVGAREIAERVLAVKCRLGRPTGAIGAPEMATGPGFATSFGLVQHTINLGVSARLPLGEAGQSLQSGASATIFNNVGNWLRAKF